MVENDWIEYGPMPARRIAVRGGAACAQRLPVASRQPARPVLTGPHAVVAHRAATPRRRLRLTGRGRVVLVVVPAVLALSSAFVGLSSPFAQADPASQRVVVVQDGDTLWSIAERVAPGADPRDTVARLEQANRLPGAVVQAGARLLVPVALGH